MLQLAIKKQTKIKMLSVVSFFVFVLLINLATKGRYSHPEVTVIFDRVLLDKTEGLCEHPCGGERFLYIVSENDNFSQLALNKMGLTACEVSEVVNISKNVVDLSCLKVGQVIQYIFDVGGRTQELRVSVQPDLDYLVVRKKDGFIGGVVRKKVLEVYNIYKGTISNNLSSSMQENLVPGALIPEAGTLLEKRNNLRQDLREGDHFDIMISSNEIEGALFSSKIEAVRITGRRIKTEIYLHCDGCYYNEFGQSLEPGFKRYPLKQSFRISSPFNPSRKHPITGLVCPHHGTDFAIPIGTNVVSPADGSVKKAGYHCFGGNYLTIEHHNGYLTHYLHLSKTLIGEGERVAMGDIIALSGNSGRSTGAHLHYELHKNGYPVDAMETPLPPSRNLEGKELEDFQERVSRWRPLLLGAWVHI